MTTTKFKETLDECWITKKGPLQICVMSNEHLQNALHHAEHRFMQFNNEMLRAADKAALFEHKMHQLRAEAEKRGIKLKSLSDLSDTKYQILCHCYNSFEK